jgi:predicted short-subunit dehydrogenase-like oxidoreductase (DUF2520 family)
MLYHAAAVMASNYLVTLAQQVCQIAATFGWTREASTAAFLPLMQGVLANLDTVGLPDALTGPIARGDVGTVAAHLEVLRGALPDSLELYVELGLATIPLAREKNPHINTKLNRISEMLIESIGKERSASCA